MDVLPISLSVSCVYLIPCHTGYLQVDTGYEKDYRIYKKRLSNLGIKISEIKYIFLSHHHDDHAGFLNHIVKETDCRIIANERAEDLLKGGENDKSEGGGYINHFIKVLADIKMRFDKNWTLSFPPFALRKDDIRIKGDDNTVLRNLGISGSTVYTPGHCVDHQALILDNGDTFCGDAAASFLLWAGTKYNTVFMTDMDQGYKSWQSMIDAGSKTLYPSHGKPFNVEKLRKNKGKISTKDLIRFF